LPVRYFPTIETMPSSRYSGKSKRNSSASFESEKPMPY
jgi:hypothetical protein